MIDLRLTNSDRRNDEIKRHKGFQNERNSMDNNSEILYGINF